MTKTAEKFWEEVLETTQTPGWKNLMGGVDSEIQGINFESCVTIEELFFLKGRMNVLRNMANTEQVARGVLAQLEADATLEEELE